MSSLGRIAVLVLCLNAHMVSAVLDRSVSTGFDSCANNQVVDGHCYVCILNFQNSNCSINDCNILSCNDVLDPSVQVCYECPPPPLDTNCNDIVIVDSHCGDQRAIRGASPNYNTLDIFKNNCNDAALGGGTCVNGSCPCVLEYTVLPRGWLWDCSHVICPPLLCAKAVKLPGHCCSQCPLVVKTAKLRVKKLR